MHSVRLSLALLLVSSVSTLAVGSPLAQAPLKVYIEAPDVGLAVKVLHDRCPICTPVIKRDAADFVLLLTPTEGKLSLSVFESVGGSLLTQVTADSVEAAIVAALDAIRGYAEKPKVASAQPGTENATVYVYRYKQFVGAAIEPSVFCDETEVARMDNGRYFTVAVKPGKHVFRSNDKQSVIELETEGGAVYYLRVEIATGFMKGHGRLVLMQPGQGSGEIRKLQPLGPDKVKDNSLVKTK
jgi:Protein of unknown function (DUF2846).